MTDFVTYQKVIDCGGCSIPLGQGQNAVVHVKGRSGRGAVLNHKVLSGEQFGEVTFNFLGQHGVVR